MPKRPTTAPEALAEIAWLASLGHTGADIHRMLSGDPRFKNGEFYGGPGLRTIQEHVRRQASHDTSGVWDLASADPATASVVLNVLAVVIRDTDGRIQEVTKAEAQWVGTIHQARPDLPEWTTYVLARMALRGEAQGESLKALTFFLAVAPWRGGDEVWEWYSDFASKTGLVFIQDWRVLGPDRDSGGWTKRGWKEARS